MAQNLLRSRIPRVGATPLVSVILVVYNGRPTIERALASVFSQNRSLVECVVVDGGSTDGTVEVLARYNDQIDRWVSEPDHGIYDAMNKGAALASGKVLYFLGCDDVLLADLSQLESLLQDPCTLVYGNAVWSDACRVYDGPFSAWKLARRNICHQAIFYPAHLLKQRGFVTEYRILADWEYNLRCFSDKSLRFRYVPVTIASFNGSGVSSHQRDDAFERDRSALYRKHLPLPVYLVHLARRTARPLARACRRWHAGISGRAAANRSGRPKGSGLLPPPHF